jgi:hypothetical protein
LRQFFVGHGTQHFVILRPVRTGTVIELGNAQFLTADFDRVGGSVNQSRDFLVRPGTKQGGLFGSPLAGKRASVASYPELPAAIRNDVGGPAELPGEDHVGLCTQQRLFSPIERSVLRVMIGNVQFLPAQPHRIQTATEQSRDILV